MLHRSWRYWSGYVRSRRFQAERRRVAALRCFGSLLQRALRGWRQHIALLRRGRAARQHLSVGALRPCRHKSCPLDGADLDRQSRSL
jgi:hypothetical protein